jgi:hypothetical protein
MFLRGRSGVETQAENSLLRKAFLRSYARRPTRSRGEELPNRHRMPNSRTVSAAVSLTASAMGPRCARLPPSFWVSLGLNYIIPLITKIANVKIVSQKPVIYNTLLMVDGLPSYHLTPLVTRE